MKKLIVSILAIAASAVAFALPNPSQIEDALAAHDYNTAKSLTQEVLRAKPESARAHLFNAYVMLKSDNPQGAAAELKTAQSLDKNHTIQNTALFGRTVTELQAYKPKAVAKPVQAAAVKAYAPQKDNSMLIAVILFGTVAGVIIIAYVWDSRPRKINSGTSHYHYNVMAYNNEGNAVMRDSEPVQPQMASFSFTSPVSTPAPQTYATHAAPTVQTVRPEPAVQMQPSFGNRVASTAAGVVAGELAADALRSAFSHKRHSSYDDEYEAPRKKRREEESQSSYDSTPSYSSSSYTDSSEDRSSYSSGSSSSWDSGSSSSSYDSGSSSWDSGSSYDSGSSSSSWD